MHRPLVITAALLSGPYAFAGAAFPQEPPQPVRVGGPISAPRKTKDVKPRYPADAQSAGVQGVVIIEATIGPTGTVQEAKILRSIPMLDEAALDAVRQWEFTPTLVNTVPTPVMMTVTVNFTLGSPPIQQSGSQPNAPPALLSVSVMTDRDGTKHIFEITVDRAEGLPRWAQSLALEPPLSASEARRAAEGWLKARNPQVVGRYELLSSSLLRAFPGPASRACGVYGCWYYRLSFQPMVGSVVSRAALISPRWYCWTARSSNPVLSGCRRRTRPAARRSLLHLCETHRMMYPSARITHRAASRSQSRGYCPR